MFVTRMTSGEIVLTTGKWVAGPFGEAGSFEELGRRVFKSDRVGEPPGDLAGVQTLIQGSWG